MPDMDTLKQLGEFCQQYGGWAVAIFLAFLLAYLLRLLEKRNTELVGLLADCKSVISANNVFMSSAEEAIEESGEGIKDNTILLNEAKIALKSNSDVLDKVRILIEIQSRGGRL
jgi:hypothetical protein